MFPEFSGGNCGMFYLQDYSHKFLTFFFFFNLESFLQDCKGENMLNEIYIAGSLQVKGMYLTP